MRRRPSSFFDRRPGGKVADHRSGAFPAAARRGQVDALDGRPGQARSGGRLRSGPASSPPPPGSEIVAAPRLHPACPGRHPRVSTREGTTLPAGGISAAHRHRLISPCCPGSPCNPPLTPTRHHARFAVYDSAGLRRWRRAAGSLDASASRLRSRASRDLPARPARALLGVWPAAGMTWVRLQSSAPIDGGFTWWRLAYHHGPTGAASRPARCASDRCRGRAAEEWRRVSLTRKRAPLLMASARTTRRTPCEMPLFWPTT